jgi:hypothetical protein
MIIFKWIFEAVVVYGSENWIVTKAEEKSSGHLKEEY